MTLATLVSGVYGSATLVAFLERGLKSLGLGSGWSSAVAFAVVTVAITFVTLILGELAPKRIALQRVEAMSLLAAPILDRISVLARPLVWLLSVCTDVVVRILGGNPKANRTVMSEEELRDLVASNQALSADERQIVGEVFDAGKRQIREVLRPRTEVEFVAEDLPLSEAAALAVRVPYSRLPVYQGSYDNVIGFVHIRDLLDPARTNRPLTVGQVSRHVKFMPNSKTVLAALSEMRRERAHLAIVVDEYGGTAGIVTLEDLVEELIGDIRDEYDVDQDRPRRLRTGEVEVDGLLNLHEFEEQTGIELPEGPYETAAGFVLAGLGEVPHGRQLGRGGRPADHGHRDGRPPHRPPAHRPAPPGPEPPDATQPPSRHPGPSPQRPFSPSPGPRPPPRPAPRRMTRPRPAPRPLTPRTARLPARQGSANGQPASQQPNGRPSSRTERAALGASAQHVGRPGLMP